MTTDGSRGMAPEPTPAIDFAVDRPYLFTVDHTDTLWPLFMAAIRDPNG